MRHLRLCQPATYPNMQIDDRKRGYSHTIACLSARRLSYTIRYTQTVSVDIGVSLHLGPEASSSPPADSADATPASLSPQMGCVAPCGMAER
jgi:hypothetical protein